MALWRANWWINLISVCEIQTDSQIRRKWPPHSLGSPRQCHPSPAPQNGLRGRAPSARMPVPTDPHCCVWLTPLPPRTVHIYLRNLPWVPTHWLVGVALKSFTGSGARVLSPQPTALGRKGHIACLPLCLPGAVHGVNMLGMRCMPEEWMAQIQQPSLLAYKKAISSTIANFTETWYQQCYHCHKPMNLFLKTLPLS